MHSALPPRSPSVLNRSVSIAARLNRLPITATHRYVTLITGIGSFFDLFDIFLAGVLGTVLTEEFQLNRVSLSAALGSAFVGMFIGATLLGRFADRVGRRTAFMLNLGIYSAFTFVGAFSVNAVMLIVSRFIAGIGIGAELPLVDAYLSEVLPTHARGRYTAWAYTLGFIGVPVAGFLGRVLVPRQPLGVDGWRWLFLVGSLGAAIVWFMRSRLPESPRWLESAGRLAEADAILARMEREAERQGTLETPGDDEPRATGRPTLAFLLLGPYRQRTIMLCVFHLFQTVGYYGFGTFVPLVLAAKGYSIVSSLTFTTLTFLGYPIGSALSLPVIERIDRKWLIVASSFLMSMFGLGLGYSVSPVAVVTFGFLYTTVSNVFSNAVHIFQVEIFPTFVRATASGTAYGLSRLSSGAMPFVLLPVLQRWGPGSMFTIIAAALWVVMLDIAVFAPSTTGRSLERLNA
ncbi:MAG: MFS transporter [Blastocatellia bacterium]|nr:MAG: MFS transporter [Blastocatellia bacterium]